MKFIVAALSVGLMLATVQTVGADLAPATQTQVKKKAKAKKATGKRKSAKVVKKTTGDLQTDVKFDDSVLHGQYQTPEEALAKVENEKGLSDLIGVRKHFKDRLQTASEEE